MLPFVAIHFSRLFSHTNTTPNMHVVCLVIVLTLKRQAQFPQKCRLKDGNFIFFHKESKSYHAFMLCNYQIGKIV